MQAKSAKNVVTLTLLADTATLLLRYHGTPPDRVPEVGMIVLGARPSPTTRRQVVSVKCSGFQPWPEPITSEASSPSLSRRARRGYRTDAISPS